MSNIDWSRLGRCQRYYKDVLGAHNIDVPWWVTQEISDVTCPPDAATYGLDLNDKKLVGSAEQSFLYMLSKGHLSQNVLYHAITPCFREEHHTSFSRKHFMKSELFMTGDIEDLRNKLLSITNACKALFMDELGLKVIERPEQHYASLPGSFDLVAVNGSDEYECGSYGVRFSPGLGAWLYATGCAEPRMSMIIASKIHLDSVSTQPVAEKHLKDKSCSSGGYHLSQIPRGVHGELSKVLEEYNEAVDAEKQGVKLMLLQELSDIILAIEAVALNNGSNLDDLIKMSAVTKRAFNVGDRVSR